MNRPFSEIPMNPIRTFALLFASADATRSAGDVSPRL